MTTFDSTKASLHDLLREIREGKIQLPDFQRGWVWDDDHIRDLLVSISRSFPIGAVMLLETGGEVRFQTRPIEGLEGQIPKDQQPEKLILDGQQRLTTLTQTLALEAPVSTTTAKGKKIKRHYYFDIRRAVEMPHALDEAVIAVDENRQWRDNFGRDVKLDLSTRELECQQLYFPCNQVMDSDDWEATLHQVAPEHFGTYMTFRSQVLAPFRKYQVPVILLKKDTSKEAVSLVFEKVNTGGVPLSVFELITASYAAEGYNLRDDWFGSKTRHVESRKARIEQDDLLKGTEATEFLQAISLLHTHEQRQADIAAGKTGKHVRPVSAKRADMLKLPLSAWKQWADDLEAGFKLVGRFLRKECFYSRRELPYSTQLVPLAAVLARLTAGWSRASTTSWRAGTGAVCSANFTAERWKRAWPMTMKSCCAGLKTTMRCHEQCAMPVFRLTVLTPCVPASVPPTRASISWCFARARRTGSGRPASANWTLTRLPWTSTISSRANGARTRASPEMNMTASSTRRSFPTRPIEKSVVMLHPFIFQRFNRKSRSV